MPGKAIFRIQAQADQGALEVERSRRSATANLACARREGSSAGRLRGHVRADRIDLIADVQLAIDAALAVQREAAVVEADAMARREAPLGAQPSAGSVLV